MKPLAMTLFWKSESHWLNTIFYLKFELAITNITSATYFTK